MPARVNASLYASDRPASRLQCSVLRIWSARGSSSPDAGRRRRVDGRRRSPACWSPAVAPAAARDWSVRASSFLLARESAGRSHRGGCRCVASDGPAVDRPRRRAGRSPGRRPPRRRPNGAARSQLFRPDLDHRLGGALGDAARSPRSRRTRGRARPSPSRRIEARAPAPAGLDVERRPVEDLGVRERRDAATRAIRRGAVARPDRADRPRARRRAGRTSARRAPGRDMTADLELAVRLDREQRPEQRARRA